MLCFCLAACGRAGRHSVIDFADSSISQGAQFLHRLAKNGFATKKSVASTLHIYIEGDGEPWLGPGKIALDPSPAESIAWQMMLNDPLPAVFVGRPCYFHTQDPNCNPGLWTNARYSREVVDSMAAVIDRIRAQYHADKLVLIGFSGGGALAVLLATRLPQIDTVITFGADLDTDAWTSFHGYSALNASLNPADFVLPERVKQLHFVGEKDDNVPANLNRRFYRVNKITPIVVKNFTHTCCWLNFWQQEETEWLRQSATMRDSGQP